MSTIWDRAVRAVQAAHPDLARADQLAGYYCGNRPPCEHLACLAVGALADADLLQYAPTDLEHQRPVRTLVAVPDDETDPPW